MIVPPKDYTGPSGGCYKVLPVEVMRTENSVVQKAALKRGELDDVYHGLNCLGKVPWSINRFVLDVAQRCWVEGVVLGDIPPREDFEMPSLPEERPNKPPSYVDKSSPEYIQYKEDI